MAVKATPPEGRGRQISGFRVLYSCGLKGRGHQIPGWGGWRLKDVGVPLVWPVSAHPQTEAQSKSCACGFGFRFSKPI